MRREQMLAFISLRVFLFAILFSAQFLVRTILDWFMPTPDFHTRATVSTMLGAGTLLAAGFSASWRSDSFAAGAVSGLVTASLAAVISITGVVILLVVWHDPETMAAIRGSGGLEEVFSLPVMMILPGVVLGSLGSVGCIAVKRAFPNLT
jgi:heme/copper-type cytochrome/quinol oxidase subunit 3